MNGFVDTLRLQGHGVFNCNVHLRDFWQLEIQLNKQNKSMCMYININSSELSG